MNKAAFIAKYAVAAFMFLIGLLAAIDGVAFDGYTAIDGVTARVFGVVLMLGSIGLTLAFYGSRDDEGGGNSPPTFD